jgi:hypothetical protein
MMLIMIILAVASVGLVFYAFFGVFTSGKPVLRQKQKTSGLPSSSSEDAGKEQKIQRLQSQVIKLESQLVEFRAVGSGEKSNVLAGQEKEAEFSAELKRREEWVDKAEAELAKIKSANLDLNSKFTAKEKELEEEFTKNVNLAREVREIKAALGAKEVACRLKEDQLQAQKHQIETQLKNISEQATAIAEFSRKEKISEWVPKSEFNQLNAEYTKLEKDLEESQERLKSFASEIVHLRQGQSQKVSAARESKSVEPAQERTRSEGSVPENRQLERTEVKETSLQELNQQKDQAGLESKMPVNLPAEVVPEVVQPLEDKSVEKIQIIDENVDKKAEEN